MEYRREIDGLRAVAVLPVILFHAGFSAFSGGFVGVDVFFVISGYLITTILLKEIRGGHFSILTFYERRARRILPALCLVTLCCIPFALAWMEPARQRDFATSLVAVFLFVSNIHFWRSTDYFASAAEETPLLHTWSLGIEEQYYLIFPIVLILLLRWRGRFAVPVLILGTLASLGLAEYASRSYPGAAFYLIPTRAWELLAGSLCAFALANKPPWRRDIAAGAGLAMIVAAVVLFDTGTRFPSILALLPVGGTVLIILCAGTGTAVARLLSTAPLVGIGLVSYSAYLWHQPLFAFARLRLLGESPAAAMLALSAATLVLAALSWRFVEQPFRHRARDARGRARALALACTVSAAFVATGLAGTGPAGLFLGRLNDPAAAALITMQARPSPGLGVDCGPGRFTTPACRNGESPVIAVWGDSFAMHLVGAISASAPDVPIIQMTMPRCGPFLDLAPYSATLGRDWSESCLRFNAAVLDWLEKDRSVSHVVLSSPFRAYLSDDWSVLQGGVGVRTADPGLALDSFRRTLERIRAAGKQPVVVSPTPQTGRNVGACLATSVWIGLDPADCDFRTDSLAPVTRQATAFLREIARDHPVIWLQDWICPAGVCRTMRDGTFLYYDHGHLTEAGARLVGRNMDLAGLVLASGTEMWRSAAPPPP